MTDRPTRPDPEAARSGSPFNRDLLLEWLDAIARRQVTLTEQIAPEELLRQALDAPSRPTPPVSERAENVPPRPFGIFSGLFGARSAPRTSGDAQTVQDQDVAAEMLSNLVYTLENHQQRSPAILRHALIGLGKIGKAAEHVPLIAPFLDGRWEQSVRLAAIDAVSNLGGEEAIDKLIALLGDSDIVVRWEVQAALDRLLVGTESAVAESAPDAPDDEPDSSDGIPF
jgi:hypothetical protein